ncbi:porin family protein [Chitinophaga nivalis]|uniref:PorT family protein n=1 Tax=Chitinophaga nivalis TaxID=2991709 RepID=A0ABT3ITX6_9BACT|nr:porin family protein [Chitinophaga nivalis]MCW3462858.1 PorT family protein [Chitinophaga nivalis]MCW3487452.1 PorT family protein [Chitinophaga nivalis]
MKSKHLSFAVLLWCLNMITQAAQAQLEVGVSGGYTNNYLRTSTGYRTFTKYDNRSGFVIGIPVRYHVNNWLAIQADPSYIQKNYEIKRTHFYDGIYQRNTISYIQLPLMAHFSFGGKKLKGFLNAGGYAGYWAGGRIKGVMANVFNSGPDIPAGEQIYKYLQFNQAYEYNEKYEFDSRRDRRIELGLVGGIGVEYLLADKFRFFVEGRYYYGLSDQQKNYMVNQIPRYNDTYVLQAGCLFSVRNLFHHAPVAASK